MIHFLRVEEDTYRNGSWLNMRLKGEMNMVKAQVSPDQSDIIVIVDIENYSTFLLDLKFSHRHDLIDDFEYLSELHLAWSKRDDSYEGTIDQFVRQEFIRIGERNRLTYVTE